jgi:iron complex transport system substrate-binding protein
MNLKKHKMKKILIFLFVLTTIISCGNNQNKTKKDLNTKNLDYARLFQIDNNKNYTLITTRKKDGTVYNKILLVKNEIKKDLPKADFIINKPVKSIGVLSSTHIGFLVALNSENLITGCANPHRIYNKQLQSRIKDGSIVNIGDDMKCNIESMISLKPDVIFTTGFEYNYNTKKILKKAGIPFIPISEWKESNILGRTEWVKLFAAFVNKQKLADSIFKETTSRYNRYKKLAKTFKNKPTIMWGSNFKGTWYMPGGKSYIGQMLVDAGSNYYFSKDTTRGSIQLNIENVIENMKDADFWLAPSAYSISEIKKQDKHYHIFKSLKTRNVFNYDKRMNKNGFNDYWESGIMHPDIILKDIIHILHPEAFKNYNTFYFRKIPETSKYKREY